MKNDGERYQIIKDIFDLSVEFLEYPNQCDYTDRIIKDIISKANRLSQIQENYYE